MTDDANSDFGIRLEELLTQLSELQAQRDLIGKACDEVRKVTRDAKAKWTRIKAVLTPAPKTRIAHSGNLVPVTSAEQPLAQLNQNWLADLERAYLDSQRREYQMVIQHGSLSVPIKKIEQAIAELNRLMAPVEAAQPT